MQSGTGHSSWKRFLLAGVAAFLLSCLFFKTELLWNWHLAPFLDGDNAVQYFPYVVRAECPLNSEQAGPWDPTLWTGLPESYIPYGRSYPGWLLYKIFPLGLGLTLALVLHQALGWLGTYLLLRDAGRSRGAAYVGGVVFAFSSFLVSVRYWMPFIQTAAWLPLIFWALERFRRNRKWLWVVVAGSFLAAHLLAGHNQTMAIAGLGWFLYGIFYTLWGEGSWRQRLQFLTGVLLAGVLGGLGALPHLLPFSEVTRWSPYRSADYGWYTWGSFSLRELVYLAGPYAREDKYWFNYFGIVNLTLAALGLAAAWRCFRGLAGAQGPDGVGFSRASRREILFWVTYTLFHAYLSLGGDSHLYAALFHLPYYKLFHAPHRHLLGITVGVAWFAALGFDYLKAVSSEEKKLVLRPVAFLFLGWTVFAFFMWARRLWAPPRTIYIPILIGLGIWFLLLVTVRSKRRWLWLGLVLVFSFAELCISRVRNRHLHAMPVAQATDPEKFPKFVRWLRQAQEDGVPPRCLMHERSQDLSCPQGNTPCQFGSLWGLSVLNCYAQSMPRSLAYLLHLNLYGATDFDRTVWEERGLSAVAGRYVVLKGAPKPGIPGVAFREYTIEEMISWGESRRTQPSEHKPFFRRWVDLNSGNSYLCEGELCAEGPLDGNVRILLWDYRSHRILGEMSFAQDDFSDGHCRFAQKMHRLAMSPGDERDKIGREPKTQCEILVEYTGSVPPRLVSLNLWQMNPEVAAKLKEKELASFVHHLHKTAFSPLELMIETSEALETSEILPGPAVYQNRQARGLATFVTEVRPAEDDLDAARKILQSKDKPVRELAFVVAPGGHSHDLQLSQARYFSPGTARVSAYHADDIQLTTTTKEDAFLVLAVTKCSGWSATVGGNPVPIHQVDGPLMGIQVPAGTHRVRFQYRPVLRSAGLWIASIALGGSWGLVFVVFGIRTRSRQQRSEVRVRFADRRAA